MAQGNYKFSKLYGQSSKSLYYNGADDGGSDVLIQVSKNSFPTLDELIGLKNDFEITSNIGFEGVLKSRELIRYESGIAIVKDYFDGVTLSEYLEQKKLTLAEFLPIAVSLARIISQLHQNNIIHKDLNPENIFISRDGGNVMLGNLCNATQLAKEQQELRLGEMLRGSLTHISPEQTGRMNRSIDHRTDLYSLGVIFYQMLCHRLPFEYKDVMELVHAHIARNPAEPHTVNDKIPKAVSGIVMKLLAKNAEDRYQGALGLLADLEDCQQQLSEKGSIDDMLIASRDHSSVLCISEKLYGRTEEIAKLLNTFERSRAGAIEMALVGGYSGIGKTRLINEIHKPIAARNGYFTSGKFDQYSRDIPYSAITQAFGSLIRQLLTESNENTSERKEKLLHAFQNNGQVLIDLIPELEMLIGKQSQVLKLGANESKVRFLGLFEQLLSILASEERPLVMFIDDLQWADSGSLDLVYKLLTGSQVHSVLLIGAYRDNEVSPSHPLIMMLDRLKQEAPGKTNTMILKELDKVQVNQLIADSLREKESDTPELTELVMTKTHGNPFFIKQFLNRLVEEKLVAFDNTSDKWTWDIKAISKMNVTDNVVDLVVSKMRKLSKPALELLSLASCIGNRFDIETLSIISNKSETDIAYMLWEAVQEGFINPLGRWSKHAKDELWKELGLKEHDAEFNFFKFQHDKIQQAANSFIPDGEKKSTHLKIGRLLLQKLSEKEVNEHLFDILGLLNFSAELISDKDEKLKIAKLNFLAGEKAKHANAYQPALNSFKAGLLLLKDNKSAELYKDFLLAASECEYFCGNFEESERLFDVALENATTNLQKAAVYASKMQVYENTQRHALAIESAKQGLKLLGTNLPLKPGMMQVMLELVKVKLLLRKKTTEQLKNNSDMQSPEMILSMKILMNLWGPVYLLNNQNLLVFFILRMVSLSVKHGNSIESAVAFAFYGYVCCAMLKDYKNGYDYSRLGMSLNEKFNDKTLRSKVLVIAEGCVAHWRDKYPNTLSNLRVAHEVGVETNDLIYAGYALTFINRSQVFMGEPLDSAYNKLKSYVHFARQIQSPVSLHQMLSVARMLTPLMGLNDERDFYGEHTDIDTHLKFLTDFAEKDKVPLALVTFYIFNGAKHYYFNEYEQAFDQLEKAIPILPSVLGLPETGEHNFYHSLSMIALLKKGHPNPGKLLKKLKTNQKMMKKWSVNAPDNFKAKYLLIEAELAGYKKDNARAADLYGEVINVSSNTNLVHVSALVFERAAEYYLEKKYNDLANLLIRDTWLRYSEWGAKAKAAQLEKTYPQLAQLVSRNNVQGAGTSIDLQSILKASTSISEAVVFESLLERLLKIVIENAGAQKGYVAIVRNGQLFVEATGVVDNEWQYITTGTPLDAAIGLSHAVVQFVYHTSETLILNDAINDMRFEQDEHVRTNKPKSILCMPVVQHGNTLAILYLENNLASNAFTKERLEILNMLSGQMAISLQNAELYRSLEEKVKERTAELELEKEKSDKLLLNILPAETAEELKQTGSYKPRKYEHVSIMFTDFVGFTNISEKLSAEELVELIDYCYNGFDDITTRHNVEKIKTIGDAYMCVSGLPQSSDDHAIRAVYAAIDMLEFMKEFNSHRKQQGLPLCEVRIGIHSGSVATGVVGKKKFAYDIWGDSVNVAVRLESASESGKINISSSTHELVKDHFNCLHRGKISVKNKGEIDMYFIESKS
jgi:histidine kinase